MTYPNHAAPRGKPPGGFRRFVGYALAAGFLLSGAVVIGAGTSHGLERGDQDDVYAALFMGGCLVLIGVLIFWGARRSAKRMKQAWNDGMLDGVMLAHMMNMGDDFGDGGDSGD